MEARGVWPMLYAFFDRFNALDRGAMRAQAEACIGFGAHGLAVLGLVTEVGKLSPAERRLLMTWAVEDAGGRVPVAITVNGATVSEQIDYVRAAADLGAAFAILQPPVGAKPNEGELIRFFASVMKSADMPMAIQNAPQYLGVGLSDAGIATLAGAHENFRVLKGEASAHAIAGTVKAAGRLAVFNGRGGLELPDVLRAGCAGMIPAPECADMQVRVFEAMAAGDEAGAERLYAEILPLITFTMQSIDQLLCYGKRLAARRLGIAEVHDRAPAMAPTDFGMATLARYGGGLPDFG